MRSFSCGIKLLIYKQLWSSTKKERSSRHFRCERKRFGNLQSQRFILYLYWTKVQTNSMCHVGYLFTSSYILRMAWIIVGMNDRETVAVGCESHDLEVRGLGGNPPPFMLIRLRLFARKCCPLVSASLFAIICVRERVSLFWSPGRNFLSLHFVAFHNEICSFINLYYKSRNAVTSNLGR
jgi:hypothetical protein